jgi:hypothetical protein
MRNLIKIKTLYIIGTVVMILIIGSVIATLRSDNSTPSSIPTSILNKASFTIFYPEKNIPHISQENKSITYSTDTDALSFLVYLDRKAIYISEQATPDIFSQSGVYDLKLSQAKEYNDFTTEAGDITLTRPVELNGQTVAWDNSKGTLILARAIKQLSISEWKTLFNNLEVINT